MLNSRAMPIVTLNQLSLAYGEDQILDAAELSIEAGERLALTGRNGAGKSTLLKLIEGEVTEDDGNLWRADHLRFAALPQALPDANDSTVFDAVAGIFRQLGDQLARYHQLILLDDPSADETTEIARLQADIEHADGWNIQHRIEATLDQLSLDPEATLESLSGGWLKRVAIAQSLVLQPDVWILDEPTNHLDLEGIQWLEELLKSFSGTIIFVSHDRALMQSVATAIIEIDRGRLTRYNCDYQTFLARREKAREVEAEHNRQFDEKLKQEEVWIRQGIKARRTRNEGRVRALKALREERAKRISLRDMRLQVDTGIASGKIVKEITGLTYSLHNKPIVTDLDLIIQRGDRIGILGPNGCGKTTLLKLLLDQLPPDTGHVKTGTRLQVAYFDQVRAQLNPDQSVFDYVSEGKDFISIGGKDTHVVTYLQNFLFSPDQSRAPIRTLSGGEQNRLLLAKLFTLPANLLVLDEPTNDLDVETLELLEELLMDYDGTVLLVSHDRQFMDNVVSSLLVFESRGRVTEYVGGYSDWRDTAEPPPTPATSRKPSNTGESSGDYKLRKQQKAAEQKRQRDLDKVTSKIESIETDIEALNATMTDAAFFELPADEQARHYDKAAALESQLEQLMVDWETLESEMDQDQPS